LSLVCEDVPPPPLPCHHENASFLCNATYVVTLPPKLSHSNHYVVILNDMAHSSLGIPSSGIAFGFGLGGRSKSNRHTTVRRAHLNSLNKVTDSVVGGFYAKQTWALSLHLCYKTWSARVFGSYARRWSNAIIEEAVVASLWAAVIGKQGFITLALKPNALEVLP